MRKKLLVFVTAICMVVTMTPLSVFAVNSVVIEKSDMSSQMPERAERESTGEREEAAAPKTEVSNSQTYNIGPNTTTVTETDVAEVNGVTYTSLQEAINASSEGDTVTLKCHLNEAVYIDKSICLDLGGYCLYSYDDIIDVIEIDAPNVVIENGKVENWNYIPEDHATAIFINDNAGATINSVGAVTVGGTASDQISSAFYIAEGGWAEFKSCEVYIDEDATEEDWINGAYIEKGGLGRFIDCSFETLSGDCCYVNGDAEFDNCYFAADTTDSCAIYIGPDAGLALIDRGYYYGDPAVYIHSDYDLELLILEGEFHSADKNLPAFDGNVDVVELYDFDGRETMSIPTDWKTGEESNHVYMFEEVAAPTTVKANLTAYYGTTAGYDDVKISWNKSSNADGYGISYKKGSGSYVDYKDYAESKRSCIIKNLSDGYKYTFMVNPYVLVNEDLLEDGGTMCYSDSYKTAYTYTLKKISTPKVTKSGTKVKVKWSNISGETGYQISKSTKKSGTNIVSTYKTTKGTYKTLKATKGKTYYYKVRAYKVVDGKKVYGPWSNVKKYKR